MPPLLFLALLPLWTFLTTVFATIACERNGLAQFPDPFQCDKYFVCHDRQAKEQICALGRVYEPRKGKCLAKGYVDCAGRPRLQRPTCPTSNGLFPVPDSCYQYVECFGQEGVLRTCPLGLIFHPASGTCDHPDAVTVHNCSVEEIFHFTCPLSHKETDDNSDDSSRLARRIYIGPPYIIDPIDLGGYYNYNYPNDYFAPSGQVTENLSPEENRFLNRLDRSYFGVVYAHDCRYFFSCLSNGKARLHLCPFGFVFNPKSSACDIPDNVPECSSYYKRNPLVFGQSPLLFDGTP